MGRFYNLIPLAVAFLICWLIKPSWWAASMVFTGTMFLWDWLWGDKRLLDIRYGWGSMALGIVLFGTAYLLSRNLGVSIGEFHHIAAGMKRREGSIVYMLPVMGVSFFLYGLIIFTLAWTRRPDDKF